MTTKEQKVDLSNENLNPKDFLISLENLPFLDSYQELGFTLKSLCKVTQTALWDGSDDKPSISNWDIFNILNLIKALIPDSELELLDLINKE